MGPRWQSFYNYTVCERTVRVMSSLVSDEAIHKGKRCLSIRICERYIHIHDNTPRIIANQPSRVCATASYLYICETKFMLASACAFSQVEVNYPTIDKTLNIFFCLSNNYSIWQVSRERFEGRYLGSFQEITRISVPGKSRWKPGRRSRAGSLWCSESFRRRWKPLKRFIVNKRIIIENIF